MDMQEYGVAAAVTFESVSDGNKELSVHSGVVQAVAVTFESVGDGTKKMKFEDGVEAVNDDSNELFGGDVVHAVAVTFESVGDGTKEMKIEDGVAAVNDESVGEDSNELFGDIDVVQAVAVTFESVGDGTKKMKVEDGVAAVNDESVGDDSNELFGVDVVHAVAVTFESVGDGTKKLEVEHGVAAAINFDFGGGAYYPAHAHDMPANFRLAAGGGELLGGMTRRQAAVLAMILGATTIIAGEPDAPWPSQLRALLVWLGGCVALFLSIRN